MVDKISNDALIYCLFRRFRLLVTCNYSKGTDLKSSLAPALAFVVFDNTNYGTMIEACVQLTAFFHINIKLFEPKYNI
jgi:hypothetical protein